MAGYDYLVWLVKKQLLTSSSWGYGTHQRILLSLTSILWPLGYTLRLFLGNIHFQVKTYTSFLISRDEYELILLLINLRFICDLISFLLHFDSEIVLRQTCFQNKLQIISQMHLHLLQILFSLMALSPLQANMSYNWR